MTRVSASVDKEIFEKMIGSIKRENAELRRSDDENKKRIEELKKIIDETKDKCEYLENLNSVYKQKIEELNNKAVSNNSDSLLEKIKSKTEISFIIDNKISDNNKFEEIFSNLISKENITPSDLRHFITEQEKYKNYIFNFSEDQIVKIFKKKVEAADTVLEMMNTEARGSVELAELMSLQKVSQGLKYFDESVKQNLKICKSFVESDISNFKYVDLDTESYYDLFFNEFEKNPKILIYLNEEIKNNPEKFVYNDEDETKKISYERKINLKIFPYLILCLGDRVAEKYSLTEKVLIDHGEIIKYLPESLRNDERYILAALKSYPELILNVREDLRSDRRFLLEALKQNPKIKNIIQVDITEDELRKENNYKLSKSFLEKIFK
ncbi:hypothetical protein HMPREF0072_0303 [Anaerococcus lactolyticus ATCC 51172]|uniref:DUF4116 domain-containing protein n=1 Tax=Anaerococcus lactolyticus ATCC 51172 TaxID=525254 RepID=C2BD83_9FIRM|nr:DUF4116 domain-containing protein [Anaerococcus lactolyticus]EEI87070.1 hypothetical protein HMPREF0072_0303 [Anaerococcus lactolyticus ATCC 51172]